ncbi:MAG: efflux RND transporter periplasmic adaptor subunit, partial [Bacteroidales bacterium]
KTVDRRIIIVVAFIFIVGLSYGIMKFLIAQGEDPKMQSPVEAMRYVRAEPVEYQTIVSPVTATGRLASLAEVDVVAEASGKILASGISLKKGSRFSKGDVLFTIYPDEAALALKSRKSRFLNILANLLPDLAVDYPEDQQRFRDFFNSVHLDEKLPPFPDVTSEQLRIFLAGRDVLSEYYGIKKDELQLGRHTVVAPFDGTYKEVYMEAGAYTNMGGRVAQAIRTDLLELEVPLERFDAGWVRVGDRATVHSDERGFEWEGIVVRKSQFVDQDNQSQGVFIRIKDNTERPLLAGEYLRATFPGQPVEKVMEVPRNVVFNTNEVFIVNDTRLHKRNIDIIKVNDNANTLLFKGVEEGEMLVMQPLINVQEGTKVEIHNEPDIQAGLSRENDSANPVK